jgi:hypothetical protein
MVELRRMRLGNDYLVSDLSCRYPGRKESFGYGFGVDATTSAPCAMDMPLTIAATSRSSCLR